MQGVLIVAGAILGLIAGAAGAGPLGLLAGAFIGWQGARLIVLRDRLNALEQAQRIEQSKREALVALAAKASVGASAAAQTRAAETSSPETKAAPIEAAAVPMPGPDPAMAPPAPKQASIEPVPPASAAAEAVAARSPPPLPSAKPAVTRGWRDEVEPPPARATATPPPARPAYAKPSTEPDLADRIGATLRRWLFEGNVPVKLGVLVLFFGLAAAMRYAVEQGLLSFPIELRLGGIAALAMAGLVWGWRNRVERPAFGLALQGGALGVLMLTVFASYRLYGLLPAELAFGLVVVLVAGAALLAVLQNAIALAVLGFVGGYLGPVLISTGSGNHVALFSYYAVLNAAVFAIAWIKPWRMLNLIGFGFTFVIGSLWGARYYRPELFASVEPFLILFFLFYVAIPVLYALREDRRGLVDGTLVFGTPLLAFPLQAGLLRGDDMALAWSALAVAALYASLAWWLLRVRRVTLLGQSFAALALGFATLAVPLALSARWTSASWAVEGAALVWLGLRQHRRLPEAAGILLQFLAAIAYFYGVMVDYPEAQSGELLIVNGHALSVLMLAVSAFFLSWLYEREGANRAVVWVFFLLGSFWWGVAGLRELVEFHPKGEPVVHSLLLFAAISILVAGLLRRVLHWPRLGWIALAGLLAGVPLAIFSMGLDDRLSGFAEHRWWLGWFAVGLAGLALLRQPLQRGISFGHVALFATAALIYGYASHEWAQASLLGDGWVFVAALLPLMALLGLTWRLPRVATWPLVDAFDHYRWRWFGPALGVLGLAWIAALTVRGSSAPLGYVPLLNPIELMQLTLWLLALGIARQRGLRDAFGPLAFAGLVFVSVAGLRAVHHLSDAPWSPSILDDRIAQATLTVIWSLAGVLAWVIGSRRGHWGVWLCGAILMGVVLLKLLLIDRRYFGDLAGIVSFIAVGALLVLVGRIAPTPPRRVENLPQGSIR